MPITNITIPEKEVAEFCRRHHILKLSLFGSVLRDDFSPDSDVDVLVIFDDEHVPSFFKLFDMEEELSALLNGSKVEMKTPEDLSKYFREEVVETAELIYEEG
jgi:predicted nucleotidyltransferase